MERSGTEWNKVEQSDVYGFNFLTQIDCHADCNFLFGKKFVFGKQLPHWRKLHFQDLLLLIFLYENQFVLSATEIE